MSIENWLKRQKDKAEERLERKHIIMYGKKLVALTWAEKVNMFNHNIIPERLKK